MGKGIVIRFTSFFWIAEWPSLNNDCTNLITCLGGGHACFLFTTMTQDRVPQETTQLEKTKNK